MTAWIDPNFLQIVGLGSEADTYAPDGRHLRWFFGRLLGFPRTGFRLRRSESPVTPARWKIVATTGDVLRFQALSEAVIGPFTHRFENGLTVSKEGGLVFQGTGPGTPSYVRVDARPVRLDFGHEGASAVPPVGPDATNPAAWARLTVVRRRQTGSVVATGYASGHGAWHFQDRAAVGVGLGALMPDVASAERVTVDGAEAAGALVGRLGADGVRAWRGAAEAEWRAVAPRRTPLTRPGFPPQPVVRNPWVADTLLLHGGLLERIEITGRDAVVVRVDWFPTRAYAGAPLWSDVDRFFLPLTDAPAIYPAWTTVPGADVAKARVMAGKPRARAPWDEPAYPPPPAAPGAIEDDLARRYLGVGYDRMREAMKIFLGGELSGGIPQALVAFDEVLESEPADDAFDGGTMAVHPFDLLVGASVDPNVARLLGLMATDETPPAGTWDYAVDAGFPSKWMLWTILEGLSPAPIDDVGGPTISIPGDAMLREAGLREQVCLSMATGIVRAPVPPPEPPADLQADVVPLPAARPVEAEVRLSWAAGVENLFAAPARVRVFFAARRRAGPGEDVPLHPKDDETGVLLPHVPTRSVTTGGRVLLRDADVPRYGGFTWRVSGMDLWGRFSPFAEVTRAVTDMVPPPAPGGLRAELTGPAASAPNWSAFRLTFDWSAGAAIAASDTVRFEVHLRQGAVSPTDSESPALWGRFEHVPGATPAPLRIDWPAATATAPPGVTATVQTSVIPDAEGGTRILVEFGPVVVPFDAAGRAVLSATVRAVDSTGNAGGFARPAIAARAELTPPSPPPPTGVLRHGTHGDALGRSSFRVALAAPPGGMVQVVRCSAAALLGTAGVDDESFTALDETARVGLLQTLATRHREVFAADHDVPYPAASASHVVELNGNDRGWTLVTTLGISRTGVRELWPTDPLRFDVIAVPHVRVPSPPVVLEARGGDRSATLWIAPDPSGLAAEVRVYRTRDATAAADVRRMRPVASLAASTDPLLFVDTGLFADVAYYYRLEASGATGARSRPASPVAVRPFSTEPPTPPEVTTVERPPDPTKRRVRWRLARRDYPVSLLRRRHGAPWWTPAETAVSRPDGTLDLQSLASTAEAGGSYAYSVEDAVPDPTTRWAYRVRVTDPQGRVVHSPAVEETP